MISHETEGRCKDISDIIRVSSSSYADNASVSMASVGFGRGISRVGSWFGTTLVIKHAYVGEKSVGSVDVIFDAEAMRGIAEVPSIYM